MDKIKELVKKNGRLAMALNDRLRAPDVAPDLLRELGQAKPEGRRWKAARAQVKEEVEKVPGRNSELEEKLRKEKELNWELRYKNRDQEDEIVKLKTQLSNSIALDDEQNFPLEAKTAHETYLERKIKDLEQKVLELEGDSRKNGKATSMV